MPVLLCALTGLGGLFAGVTGPLLSNFIPPLVRDAIGENRTAIGAVMAIDNVLLLLLVPWAGAASDRASAHDPLFVEPVPGPRAACSPPCSCCAWRSAARLAIR